MVCADRPTVFGPGMHHQAQEIIVGLWAGVLPHADQLVDARRELREAAGNALPALGLSRSRPAAMEKLVAPADDWIV